MASLWRALALAWLGGIASPGLLDDAAMAEAAPSAIIGAPSESPAATDALAERTGCDRDTDETPQFRTTGEA